MLKLSLSDWLAIFGIAAMFVLTALDKAGKLKGPWPLVLLAIAALFTLPLVFGNAWVGDAPSTMLKATRSILLCFTVGLGYSVLAIWMSAGTAYDAFVKTQSGPLLNPVSDEFAREKEKGRQAAEALRKIDQPPGTSNSSIKAA